MGKMYDTDKLLFLSEKLNKIFYFLNVKKYSRNILPSEAVELHRMSVRTVFVRTFI